MRWSFLQMQQNIFGIMTFAFLIAVLISLFSKGSNIFFVTRVSVLALTFALFSAGLYQKSEWAYHFGFGVVILLFINTLSWQIYFKDFFLQSLQHLAQWKLNIIAIANVAIVSSLFFVLLVSLAIQIKLKNELKE